MNHDLTHCQGRECPIRENCLRYLAHLQAPSTGIPYIPYTTEMIDHGYCPMYVRSEEYKGISQFNNRRK